MQFYIPELYSDVTLNNVWGKDNQKYVMAFTSKERFQVCNDTSGLVMFIGDVFRVVEKKDEVQGIVLNWNKEEMVIGKDMIRAFYIPLKN